MAYAEFPHIEASFSPVGTGTPYKIDWVNNVAGVLIAAGWEVETVTASNTDTNINGGGNYHRTIAPVIVELEQTDVFDSFGLFASPPGDTCDGLSVWSIWPPGQKLNVGHDVDFAQETLDCCYEGTGGCPSGTTTCSGTKTCTITSDWTFTLGGGNDADFQSNHSDLITQFIQNTRIGTNSATGTLLWTDIVRVSGTGDITTMRSYIAVWEPGGVEEPVIGPKEITPASVGAAFNTTVDVYHGGWVLQSQPSNTTENFTTVYLAVDTEGNTFPVLYTFSTYTASTHPIQYLKPQISGTTTVAALSGLAHNNGLTNTTNDMRLIANPHHAHMYSHRGGTAVGTGSTNYFNVGAIRNVPVKGEDPTDPTGWSFRKAVFHLGGGAGGDNTKGLHMRNWVDTDNVCWYMVIETGAGTLTRSVSTDDDQLAVAGFAITDRVKAGEAPPQWVSGEAFYSEPWVSFNAGTSTVQTKSPVLGQMWDTIVPSKVGGSGYFFWDGEWWTHWQTLRTDTSATAGPQANVAFRVGFQTLEGEEPVLGVWVWPVEPRDVLLYNALQNGVIDPFPWGNVTAVSISSNTFAGGTDTRTLTATCTQHPDAQDDGTKLVAVHSTKNYFTFTPEVISIGSGATTGTSVVTAVSPGLGGVSVDILADSITQASVAVTVND